MTGLTWVDLGICLMLTIGLLNALTTKVLGNVEQGAHLIGSVFVAKSARIRSGSLHRRTSLHRRRSRYWDQTVLSAREQALAKKSESATPVKLKNSLIMDGTHVGHLSYVGDSVFGENAI